MNKFECMHIDAHIPTTIETTLTPVKSSPKGSVVHVQIRLRDLLVVLFVPRERRLGIVHSKRPIRGYWDTNKTIHRLTNHRSHHSRRGECGCVRGR